MDPRNRRTRAASRLLTVFAMALVAVAGYYGIRRSDPVAAVVRRFEPTPQQEVALGLQAAPAMAQKYGGLSADLQAQRRVDRICHDLVAKTAAERSPYDFDCHLLADGRTAAAFSLPGGQVFLTTGLLERMQTDDQLAAVLAHQIAHVLARHGSERLAEARLRRGLTGAAVLARYDPDNPAHRRDGDVAALIGQLLDLRFTRRQEQEADRLGVQLASQAGYDPRGGAETAGAACGTAPNKT